MLRLHDLPINDDFQSVDEYIEALFSFVASHELFRALCGGVHILGFFTVKPDIYQSILPASWRHWFSLHDVPAILDLLLREDVLALRNLNCIAGKESSTSSWRGCALPPSSLLDFIVSVRKLSLNRKQRISHAWEKPPHSMVVGMKPKKIHETQHFARYIQELRASIAQNYGHRVSHIVDFGSGQNYLGRTLASPPYNERIIAIERKQQNIGGAQVMDVHAKLVEKPKVIRNKKAFRNRSDMSTEARLDSPGVAAETRQAACLHKFAAAATAESSTSSLSDKPVVYVQQNIENGDLSYLETVIATPSSFDATDPQFMVISLHSCGDLLHHGLQSLTSNTRVKAVAMIGCCYHLTSNTIGPPTWKPPYSQQQQHVDADEVSLQRRPHGFPMSERLLTYRHRNGESIKLNITARMMASQAPQNWTDQDCNSFFTRHFYRAMLQKIFSDYGVLSQANGTDTQEGNEIDETAPSLDVPITIGSLRKGCYESFVAYVRGAMQKMGEGRTNGLRVERKLHFLQDKDILAYEERFACRKKDLSIMWSLMAFCAGVSESVILVDRFLYLREQPEVDQCWVEPVFDYAQSPRNLAVIGIKK